MPPSAGLPDPDPRALSKEVRRRRASRRGRLRARRGGGCARPHRPREARDQAAEAERQPQAFSCPGPPVAAAARAARDRAARARLRGGESTPPFVRVWGREVSGAQVEQSRTQTRKTQRELATEAQRHRENFYSLCLCVSVVQLLCASVSLWRLS